MFKILNASKHSGNDPKFKLYNCVQNSIASVYAPFSLLLDASNCFKLFNRTIPLLIVPVNALRCNDDDSSLSMLYYSSAVEPVNLLELRFKSDE